MNAREIMGGGGGGVISKADGGDSRRLSLLRWGSGIRSQKGKKEKEKKGFFFFFFFCILLGERLCSVLDKGFRVSFWDLGVGRLCSKALQILGRWFYQSIA